MAKVGGRRPGAGRKPGSKTKKTSALAKRLNVDGITPLEVMVETMRHHYAAGNLNEAAAVAKDCAPYMHPRLNATTVSNKEGEAFRVESGARELLLGRISQLTARA